MARFIVIIVGILQSSLIYKDNLVYEKMSEKLNNTLICLLFDLNFDLLKETTKGRER